MPAWSASVLIPATMSDSGAAGALIFILIVVGDAFLGAMLLGLFVATAIGTPGWRRPRRWLLLLLLVMLPLLSILLIPIDDTFNIPAGSGLALKIFPYASIPVFLICMVLARVLFSARITTLAKDLIFTAIASGVFIYHSQALNKPRNHGEGDLDNALEHLLAEALGDIMYFYLAVVIYLLLRMTYRTLFQSAAEAPRSDQSGSPLD